MKLVFHRLILKDLQSVLAYYTAQSGPELAECFSREFHEVVAKVVEQPRHFHFVSHGLRRANFPRFPFHLLYRETEGSIKILVLRHHRRKPGFGMERQ
ncbi:MAG: type II toxin-antitoxin system RelE/ParE family toxin [Verrucomicrobiota bacterium]